MLIVNHWVRIGSQKSARKLYVGICYRSPSADENEIKNMLGVLNRLSSKSIVLMGDFNYGGIDWDNNLASNKKEEEFLDLVNDTFLTQHVKVPTREENILDLVNLEW